MSSRKWHLKLKTVFDLKFLPEKCVILTKTRVVQFMGVVLSKNTKIRVFIMVSEK